MVTWTLAASATFAVVSAAVYLRLANVLSGRDVTDDSKLASKSFVAWWVAFAATTLIGAIESAWAAFGTVPFAVALALFYAVLAAIVVGLWGLTFYFVYLYTGKRSAWFPVAAYWVGVFVLLLVWVVQSNPVGVAVARWDVSLDFANDTTSGPLYLAVLISILAPVLIGATAYLRLMSKVEARTQRVRIAAVAGSFIVWFGASLIASLLGVSNEDWWQLVSRSLGLGAAIVILAVHDPPDWLREKGIEPVE